MLLAAKSFEGAVTALPPITVAEIRDFKSANNLSYALQKGEGEGELYERVEPLALGNIIG